MSRKVLPSLGREDPHSVPKIEVGGGSPSAVAGIPRAHLRPPDKLYKGYSVAVTEPGVEKALLITARALGLARPRPPPHTLQEARLRPSPPGISLGPERQESMLQHGGASLDEPEARGGGSPAPERTAGVAPGRGPGGRDARSPPDAQ